MSWLEVTFHLREDQAENCAHQLEALGAAATSFFDAADEPLLEPIPGTTPLWSKVKVVGLFSADQPLSRLFSLLSNHFKTWPFSISPLVEQEWSRTWLEHFKPMQFGEKLWIVPSHEVANFIPSPTRVTMQLDPGLAFGTGTHPTTALCLEWLSRQKVAHQTWLDYGCGSGILGIAALLLGAKKVWAVDYDEQALLSTRENGARNRLDPDTLATTLPADLPRDLQVTGVVANILAEPLIQLAPTLRQYCQIGGWLVLSGLLDTQLEKVQAAYHPWFNFEITQQQEWLLLTGRRKN